MLAYPQTILKLSLTPSAHKGCHVMESLYIQYFEEGWISPSMLNIVLTQWDIAAATASE